jgi:hypothetical protein
MNSAPYTYVEMSLAVPWALYFVFLAGVTIPFVVMIVARGHLSPFVRYVLPLILVGVIAIVALFVVNALESTHLMQTEKRAGPTMLSR